MAPNGVTSPVNMLNNNTTTNTKSTSLKREKMSCGQKVTNKINRALENGFARIGFTIASNPLKSIFISLLCAGLCVIGILEYTTENRNEKNWVSQSSVILKEKAWVEENYPSSIRVMSLMLQTSGNADILTQKGLLDLLKTNQKVLNLQTNYVSENGTTVPATWDSSCYRIAGQCIPTSILELWFYNETIISNLTDVQIKAAVNQKGVRSPMTGKTMVLDNLIGGPASKDANGNIISASVFRIDYKLKKQEVFDSGKGLWVDKQGERIEEEFGNILKTAPAGYMLFSYSRWAQAKTSSETSQGDLQFFIVGYILVIIYLSFMLGSFSRINHKVYLALAGILVIGISIGVSYGLGSAFQFKKTVVHDVLPFLLLGIGVDDIFVIVQNWDNVGGPVDDGKSVPEKASAALRHAGVSILVTTITDICAFLVGASTILPALQSFCIFAAIGILSVFILTITFFVPLLALDAKRQHGRRDACLCCIKLNEDWEPMACSQKGYLQLFVKNIYGPAVLSIPGKVIVLLITAGVLAGGGYGLSKLKQDFDRNWFLPKDSVTRMFADNQKIFFPANGVTSNVYTGVIDYYNEYNAFIDIAQKISNDPYVNKDSVNSWYTFYHRWLNGTNHALNRTVLCQNDVIGCRAPNETKFYEYLQEYFFTEEGAFFINHIQFDKKRTKIEASRIDFQHVLFNGAAEEVRGMDSVRGDIIHGSIQSESNSLLPFAYCPPYIGWETNKVISEELFRNILLAGACVLVVTLFLISNILTSFLVLICVVVSLVDLAGYMHFWGLTIDTVTTIIMVLAIGLTVDYSAHIGHGFMAARKGTRNERMQHALEEIGPAVFHGGFSTLLAFLLLSASQSYVFFAFFRVFFLVVTFGMFHGLFFLPVALSLIGPKPYAMHYEAGEDVTPPAQLPQQKSEPIHLEKLKTNGNTYSNCKTFDNPAYVIEY